MLSYARVSTNMSNLHHEEAPRATQVTSLQQVTNTQRQVIVWTPKCILLDRWQRVICSANYHIERKKPEMKNLLTRLWREDDGQDLTEYALLVVLVALGSLAAMSSLATNISTAFAKAGSNLTT